MILNYIFNNSFNIKTLEYVSYFNMLIISLYTSYNLYYNIDLTNNIFYLFCFIIIDTMFIPYNRIDTFIHHFDTMAILLYIYYYNIDIKINNYATIQLLKTEISTVFLGLTYFLKKYKFNKNLQTLSNLIFIYTFYKYRVHDFCKNIYLDSYFFNSLTTNNSNFQLYYKYTSTNILYGLNLYWFAVILKILFKSINLNKIKELFSYFSLNKNLSTL